MTKKKTAPADKKKTAKKVKAKKQSRKPEFENALDEVITESHREEVGKRPGPGVRDPGAEDNIERVDRESSKAPQAIAPVLKIPFSIWASVSEIPEMKLSDVEAQELAEPVVALLEYYFPGKIPEIAWMWLMFLAATEKVIDSRVKIRYEKRKERSLGSSTPKEPVGSHNTTPQPAPIHKGAEPAAGYPKE